MLFDGVLDVDEFVELFEIFRGFGGFFVFKLKLSDNVFILLNVFLFNNLVFKFEWLGYFYVFIGVMVYGFRKYCEEIVVNCGGGIVLGISKKVYYLVVGEIGNEQWFYSIYGIKIK